MTDPTTTASQTARIATLIRALTAIRAEVDDAVRTLADAQVDASAHLTAAVNELHAAVYYLRATTPDA